MLTYLWLVLVSIPRHNHCIFVQAVLEIKLLPRFIQGRHGSGVPLSLDLSHKLPVNVILVTN